MKNMIAMDMETFKKNKIMLLRDELGPTEFPLGVLLVTRSREERSLFFIIHNSYFCIHRPAPILRRLERPGTV